MHLNQGHLPLIKHFATHVASILFSALLLAVFSSGTSARTHKPVSIKVSAQPFTLDLLQPWRTTFGKLEWRGGLVLTSPHPRFGGFSGLTIDASGKHLIAVSDRGHWLRAELTYKDSAPSGLIKAQMGPLLSRKGKTLKSKKTQDAEAITLISGTTLKGEVLIGFERLHRIGRFPVTKAGIGAPRYINLPGKLKRARSNKGIEAVAQLRAGPRKGAIVAFPERYKDGKGRLRGWLIGRRRSGTIRLKRRDKFDITDLAALPDGGLLVLERRYRKPKNWFLDLADVVRMRIRRIAPGDIKPGAVLDGEILIEANRALKIDNMEGIAVHRSATGETIVTLISDDNFDPVLQSTLLMQFALPRPKSISKSKSRAKK